MNNDLPGCARCPIEARDRLCQKENGKSPKFCPTMNNKEAISNALNEFKKPDVMEFARQASIQEGEGYGDKGKEDTISRQPRAGRAPRAE